MIKIIALLKKKLKIGLPDDSEIPLLGIYPKKMKTLIGKDTKDTCAPMFTAALFITAEVEATCMSIHRRMEKEDVVNIYIIKFTSPLQKNETLPFATAWIDLQGIMYYAK